MKFVRKVKSEVQNDENLIRARRYAVQGFRALPSATAQYIVEKVPIVQWLPKYSPRWLPDDVIAGITLGVLLIPQGLSYAKIARIPVEFGLMASWLPALIYAFMGTSKGQTRFPQLSTPLLTALQIYPQAQRR